MLKKRGQVSLRAMVLIIILTGLILIFSTYSAQPESRQTQDGNISPNEYEYETKLDGDNFILHWRVSEDKIKIAIEGSTTGWVAIGFDPDFKMKNADMIFGWVDESGEVTVLDTFSIDDNGPHPVDKIDNILSFGGMEKDGRTVIEFERLLKTGDDQDKDIPKDGELEILWAVGSDDDFNSVHTQRGHGTINIETGEYSAGFEIWPIHASFMVIGLSLIIIGSCIARTMRKKNWWLKVHKVSSGLGSIFAIIGLTISIYMVETAATGHIRLPHSILGIITIILLIKTPIIGLLILRSKSMPKKRRKDLRTYHRWIGRIATVFMVITLTSGLILKGII